MSDTKPEQNAAERLYFPGLASAAFEHPLDRAALEALRRTPGFDRMLKFLSEWGAERFLRMSFTGDSIRISSRQCGRLHRDLREACAILDIREKDYPIDFYLAQDPYPDLYIFGMQRHTLVITTGMVDLLSDEERLALIGRELGHVKTEHILYRTLGLLLVKILSETSRSILLPGAILTEALFFALYVWFRRSELTADRAGLLVAQNSETCVRALLKTVAGSQKLADDLNTDEFVKQADALDDLDEDLISVYFKFAVMRRQAHPFPAYRAREIREWAQTDQYLRILRGEYPRTDSEAGKRLCMLCGNSVLNVTFRFCPECGNPLDPVAFGDSAERK